MSNKDDRVVMADLADSLDGISSSGVFVQLFSPSMVNDPGGDAFPLFQLGAAIMLDKPLIVIVDASDRVPIRLRRAADKIIEVRNLRGGGMALARAAVVQALRDLAVKVEGEPI